MAHHQNLVNYSVLEGIYKILKASEVSDLDSKTSLCFIRDLILNRADFEEPQFKFFSDSLVKLKTIDGPNSYPVCLFKDPLTEEYLMSYYTRDQQAISLWVLFTVKPRDIYRYLVRATSLKTLVENAARHALITCVGPKIVGEKDVSLGELIGLQLVPPPEAFFADSFTDSFHKWVVQEFDKPDSLGDCGKCGFPVFETLNNLDGEVFGLNSYHPLCSIYILGEGVIDRESEDSELLPIANKKDIPDGVLEFKLKNIS